MTNKTTIPFCFTSKQAKELYNNQPPQYATERASGFDLRACKYDNDVSSIPRFKVNEEEKNNIIAFLTTDIKGCCQYEIAEKFKLDKIFSDNLINFYRHLTSCIDDNIKYQENLDYKCFFFLNDILYLCKPAFVIRDLYDSTLDVQYYELKELTRFNYKELQPNARILIKTGIRMSLSCLYEYTYKSERLGEDSLKKIKMWSNNNNTGVIGYDIPIYQLTNKELRAGGFMHSVELSLQSKSFDSISELQIRSLAEREEKQGLVVASGIRTIDNDNTNELCFMLRNISSMTQEIKLGDKVCQGILNPIMQAEFQEYSQEQFEKKFCKSDRGSGGFGSTGSN